MSNINIMYPNIREYYISSGNITMVFEQSSRVYGELHGYILGWYQGNINVDMTRYIIENRRSSVGETYPHSLVRREYE